MASNVLFVNPKWRRTEVQDALTKISFKLIFDDSMELLDFKCSSFGLCYLPKVAGDTLKQHPHDFKQLLAEYRKLLARVHNTHTNIHIQALVDYTSNKELFNAIQEFCTVELKIQVVPIDNASELAQYVERLITTECQDMDKNPFLKDLSPNDLDRSAEQFLICLKKLPKVGDKTAQILLKSYKNLKTLSNASCEELAGKIGAGLAKSIHDFFHNGL